MDERQDQLTGEAFRKELIDRFFNPSSFFHHCITCRLEKLLTEKEFSMYSEQLLLANIIDRLVACEDTEEELSKLAAVPGLDMVQEKLFDAANRLREDELDVAQLKLEIENLTQDLVDCVLQQLENEEIVASVKEYLGDNDNKEQIPVELVEPPSDSPDNAEPVISVQNMDDFTLSLDDMDVSSEQENDKDIDNLGGIGTDENNEGGSTSAIEEESIPDIPSETPEPTSVISDPDQKNLSLAALVESQPGETEPARFLSVFKQRLVAHLNDLRVILNSLSSDSVADKLWQACDVVLQGVAEDAMIYGLEGFEQIATKSRKLIQNTECTDERYTQYVISLLHECCDVLQALADSDIECHDSTVILKLSDKLRNPEQYMPPACNAPEAETDEIGLPEQDELEAPNDSASDVPEALAAELILPPEESDASIDTAEVPDLDDPELDLLEIKLPGEEDEELKALIKEVSQDRSAGGNENASEGEQSELQLESNNVSVAPLPNLEAFSIHEEFPGEFSDRNLNDPFEAFQLQGELYFNVYDDAIESLEQTPDDKSAVEDLELACESLHSLAGKLSLDELSCFPEIALDIARNILETDFALSEVDLQLLRETFNSYRNIKTIEDLKSNTYERLLGQVKELNKIITTNSQNNGEPIESVNQTEDEADNKIELA